MLLSRSGPAYALSQSHGIKRGVITNMPHLMAALSHCTSLRCAQQETHLQWLWKVPVVQGHRHLDACCIQSACQVLVELHPGWVDLQAGKGTASALGLVEGRKDALR